MLWEGSCHPLDARDNVIDELCSFIDNSLEQGKEVGPFWLNETISYLYFLKLILSQTGGSTHIFHDKIGPWREQCLSVFEDSRQDYEKQSDFEADRQFIIELINEIEQL